MMFKKYRLLDASGGPMHLVAFESEDSSVIVLAFSPEVQQRAHQNWLPDWKEGMTASPEGTREPREVVGLLPFLSGLGYLFMLQADELFLPPTADYSEIQKFLRSLY